MENKELLIQYDQEVNRLFQENKKLKSKIDKAIEYIENIEEDKEVDNLYINKKEKSFLTFYKIKNDILKILKGEENE